MMKKIYIHTYIISFTKVRKLTIPNCSPPTTSTQGDNLNTSNKHCWLLSVYINTEPNLL